MRNGNYESSDEGGVEPHYQQGSTRGLYTYVYVNGDEHFLPKKLLVNPKRDRTYNAFLDYATKVLNPRYGAVRNIYTPEGRHRIRGFEDMTPDGRYVACGRERYKRLDRPYTQIEAPSPRRRNRHSNRSDERLIPAHHNKHLENVTGKISQIPTQGKAIEVFVNGQDIDKPTTVGLSYRQLENMTEAIKVVHEAIREKHQYRVDQICDLEGHVVTDVNQLETGGLYVAKNSYHTFKPGRYEPHGRKNIIVPLSPRDKQQTKYLWKERSTFGGPSDYRRPRTLPPINSQKKHSPDHSVSSYPETRKRNQVNGVPVKAAKHTKRTPKQADYDKDDGGVFKAKGQNRDTRGAKEVRDNGDTKVDLPIDQVRAEEVKDERIRKEKQGKDSDASGQNNSGTVPPPMHNARPAPNGAKPGSTDSKPDTKPTPGTDAKNTPNVKDTKESDPNKKTDVMAGGAVKTSGPDTKPADPNAKPLAGPDAKPSGPDSKPPASDSKKPPVGDSNPATGDNKPPAGDKKPPPGDSKPPVGDNKPPVGDNKPPAGDNKPPVGDNKPPAGDNKPPAGDNKLPADPNKQPTDNKPTAGPDSGPDNNANT
ncbi:doublecortin domain-containing protein 2C-like isoform X30 [Mytilus galloprovincialis]|uniref:doublecortin domain-containing protein 2C-like isoform X30 n=1 Tax=Mytilus galloprovincialis TaxID=29158 RepID=UPI003F7B5120